MPKTQTNTGYDFYTLFHSNTGVLNMDLLRKIYLRKKKKVKARFVCETVPRAAPRESIHRHVRVWATCNDIILTRVTPHCHRAFFSRSSWNWHKLHKHSRHFFLKAGFLWGSLHRKDRQCELRPLVLNLRHFMYLMGGAIISHSLQK